MSDVHHENHIDPDKLIEGESVTADWAEVTCEACLPRQEADGGDVSNDPCWEVLVEERSEFHIDQTSRLQVPGGWLYRESRETYDETERAVTVSITFVPEPEKH